MLFRSLGRDRIESNQSAYCQISLDDPALAMRGDRFILRDEVARRTLGGGIVLHPWAQRHKQKEEGGWHRVERSYGSFERSFSLPDTVNPEAVTADYKNGTLTVNLPKKEIAKPRQVKVQVGQSN